MHPVEWTPELKCERADVPENCRTPFPSFQNTSSLVSKGVSVSGLKAGERGRQWCHGTAMAGHWVGNQAKGRQGEVSCIWPTWCFQLFLQSGHTDRLIPTRLLSFGAQVPSRVFIHRHDLT